MKRNLLLIVSFFCVFSSIFAFAGESKTVAPPPAPITAAPNVPSEYKVGVNDILTVAVLQPDPFSVELTVSPDGTVNFPYIGSVQVRELALSEIQEKIQTGLKDYLKYPVVSVSLKEAKSRTFYVYGEVARPGSYPLDRETSLVQAITTAGGFTRVASTNNVKVLRQKPDGSGNTTITVDVNAVMTGKSQDTLKIQHGDVVTVSQRFF